MYKVRTWAGLNTRRSKGVFGVGVDDHLVDFAVIELQRWTGVLTGTIIIKVFTGLQKSTKQRGSSSNAQY